MAIPAHSIQYQVDGYPNPTPGNNRATLSRYPHEYKNMNKEGPTHTAEELSRLRHGDGKLYEYPIRPPNQAHFDCNKRTRGVNSTNHPGAFRMTTDSRKVSQGAIYHYGERNNFRRGELQHIKQPMPKRPIVTF